MLLKKRRLFYKRTLKAKLYYIVFTKNIAPVFKTSLLFYKFLYIEYGGREGKGNSFKITLIMKANVICYTFKSNAYEGIKNK